MFKWPNGKNFAFTIIDDTDGATVKNIKPVYDYLKKKGIYTTKTVWAYPPRDSYRGESLSDLEYRDFVSDLHQNGFEIAFHGAGSGKFFREETLNALEDIREVTGCYPQIHINHADNSDGIYWGQKRFPKLISSFYAFYKKLCNNQNEYLGDDPQSRYFWGDICKERIKYIRNRVFSGINTFKYDKYMPYREKGKDMYSNYWFSSSDGINKKTFVKLLSRKNINKLIKENGCCILYTHFAFGFTDPNGRLDKEFCECIDYISSQKGWFVPASKLLDYLLKEKKGQNPISFIKIIKLDCVWLFERIYRKIAWNI